MRISRWLKVLMAMVCICPIAFALWVPFYQFQREGSLESVVVASSIACMMILTFGFFGVRFYRICSVVLSESGVAQRFFYTTNGFFEARKIEWQEVTDISFSDFSYYLTDSVSRIEINTSLFSHRDEVIRYVRAHLPSHMLLRLDGKPA